MNILRKILVWLKRVAAFVIIIIPIVLKTEASTNLWPWIIGGIDWFKHWALFLFIPSILIVPICVWIESFFRKQCLIDNQITSLLRQACGVGFKQNPDQALPHQHRVTLFKNHRNRLKIVARSSKLTKKSKTNFKISDDPQKCVGVAGRAWARIMVFVDNLPEITENSIEEHGNEYSSKTGVDIEWLRNRLSEKKDIARSYLAMPVEVYNELWGVLVWDSVAPDGIRYDKKPSAKNEAYVFIASAIAKLLECVKGCGHE